jgi:hypothetical protein
MLYSSEEYVVSECVIFSKCSPLTPIRLCTVILLNFNVNTEDLNKHYFACFLFTLHAKL